MINGISDDFKNAFMEEMDIILHGPEAELGLKSKKEGN